MTKEKYYIEEVFKFLEKVDYYFGSNFTADDVDMIRGAVEGVNPAYRVTNGASKCVIIPDDRNYVIKIPFTGDSSDEIYEKDEEFYDYCCENGFDYEACPYDKWEFENAGNSQNGWDYCLRETEIYNAAKDCGIEQFFAKTIHIGDYHHHPIYIQEKCTTEYNTWNSPYRRDIDLYQNFDTHKYSKADSYLEKCYRDAFDWNTESNWFICLFSYLKNRKGLTKTYKLLNKIAMFLDEEDVSDLHSSNIGLIEKNDRPVFVDYSGFDC